MNAFFILSKFYTESIIMSEKEKPNYYAIIPANVRYDENLSANTKLMYGEITALSNKHGYCFASNKYFSNLYGVSITSISTWINQLKQNGYIIIEMVYENPQKITQRRITITTNRGIKENFNRGIKENFKDNSIDYNNTINSIYSDSDESPKKVLTHPIMDYWNSLETTRKHLKADSKVYKTAIRYLKQLNTGTFGKMVTLKVEQKLSSTDRIKKWTNDEIKQVLDTTLLVFQAGYWPTDKSQIPTDLASLIYNPRSQFSWFLRCWKNPPQAIEQQIEIISKDEKALSLYQQVFNVSSQKMNRRLVMIVNVLYDWYTKKMLQYPSASFDAHFGTFERFAKKHCEWLYTQGKDIHLSYCKLDAQNFTRFLDSIQKNYGYNLNPTDEQRKKIQQQIDMQQQQIQSARKARGRK